MPLSGGNLLVYDPACCIWPSAEAGSGQGRHYKVVGTDLATGFADQFSGWDFAGPVTFKREVAGTYIRIPLSRQSRSRFAQVSCSPYPFTLQQLL